MNDRRRVRLFLDHKAPLVAFTVVSIACALMMVHVARSDAAPGWLRAGLGGVVAQRIAEATVLQPEPEAERATEAVGSLAAGPGGATPSPRGRSDEDTPTSDDPSGGAAGAQAGAVRTPSGPDAGATDDDHADLPGDEVVVGGEVTAPGPGQGASAGRGPQPVSEVPVPGASPGRGPQSPHDWRDEWVGDRGEGKSHGHGPRQGEGHGKDQGGDEGGDKGRDDHGPGSPTPGSPGPGQGPGQGPGHGHGHGPGHGHGDADGDRGPAGGQGPGKHGHPGDHGSGHGHGPSAHGHGPHGHR